MLKNLKLELLAVIDLTDLNNQTITLLGVSSSELNEGIVII